MNLQYIISLILINTVAIHGEWEGCSLSLGSDDNLVKGGEVSSVCLTVGPSTDWGANNTNFEYNRFTFQPKADEFSHMHIDGSYEAYSNENEDKHIFVASQTAVSFLRKYYDATLDHIFPHLTAIIDVEDGVVKGIAWDDACVFCSETNCKANTYNFAGELQELKENTGGCYWTKKECDTIKANNGTECDLNLYVVWTGTDKDGKLLTSSNMRFSLFNPKQIRDSLKDALSNSLDAVDVFGWLKR